MFLPPQMEAWTFTPPLALKASFKMECLTSASIKQIPIFSIRRVNTLTPFQSFGAVQHVEIFITGDSAASNGSIKAASKGPPSLHGYLWQNALKLALSKNRLEGQSFQLLQTQVPCLK
jgi:hypothetical protein